MDIQEIDVRVGIAKLTVIAESLDQRVDSILEQTTRTNGRLVAVERVSSVHDSQIASLMADYARLRDARIGFRDELQAAIAAHTAEQQQKADANERGEHRRITHRDVWMFVEYMIRLLERGAV
jgi:hypothetical protein